MTDKTLTLTRIIKAPIQQVWEAWTKPDALQQWLSPEGMTNPEVTADLTTGGKYRIVMEGHNMPNPEHNGIMAVGGTYLKIEKPNLLSFTWLWEGAPLQTHTTTVTINLRKMDNATTELTLTQTGFPDEDMFSQHSKGWNSTFNKLNAFINIKHTV